MAIHYRSRGLVLKKINRGEADQFFVIYTEDFGKLEILGKAIRKIKSKLKSGIELFYLSDIEFIQGKTHKTLTDAILIEKFKNIRNDLERLKIAYQMVEAADNLIRGQERDEQIWDLLNEAFNKLNIWKLEIGNSLEIRKQPFGESALRPVKLEIIYFYFLWNLLSILGYQIDLYNCGPCQKKLIPQKLYFSPEEGGIICGQCSKKIKEGTEVSPEVIKILRIFLKKDWQTLIKLKIEDSLKKSLELISENYLSYYKIVR